MKMLNFFGLGFSLFLEKYKRALVTIIIFSLLIFSISWIINNGFLSILNSNKLFEQDETYNLNSSSPNQNSVLNQILYDLQFGKYEYAIKNIASAQEIFPNDKKILDIKSKLFDELKIDFKFNYLPDRRRKLTTRNPSINIELTHNDPYYLTINCSEENFLYVLQVKNSGEIVNLFPSDYASEMNPFPGGSLRIPKNYDWFYLDSISTPGFETIYLLACRWPQKHLEQMIEELKDVVDLDQIKEITSQIMDHFQRAEETADKLPGLVYSEYKFRHIVGNQSLLSL